MVWARSLVFILLGLATAAIPSRLLASPLSCEEIFESAHFSETENYRVEILNGFRHSADSLKKYRESLEEDFDKSVTFQHGLPDGEAIVVRGIKIDRVPLSKSPTIHERTWQAFRKAFHINGTRVDSTLAIELAKKDPYFLWLKAENPSRDPVGFLTIMLIAEPARTRLTPKLALMHIERQFNTTLAPDQIALVDEAVDMYKAELALRLFGVHVFQTRDVLSNQTWNLAPNYKQVMRNLQSVLVHTAQPHMRKFSAGSYGIALHMIASQDPLLDVLTKIGAIRLQREVSKSEYADFAPDLQKLRETLKLPANFDLTKMYDAMNLVHRNFSHNDLGYEGFLIDTFEPESPRRRTISELRLILELAAAPASQKGVQDFVFKYKEFLRLRY